MNDVDLPCEDPQCQHLESEHRYDGPQGIERFVPDTSKCCVHPGCPCLKYQGKAE